MHECENCGYYFGDENGIYCKECGAVGCYECFRGEELCGDCGIKLYIKLAKRFGEEPFPKKKPDWKEDGS